ncbi:MAG: tyrosine--tRNA ligase [Thermoleophilaceae bacterium]|nr:tyrosine--tRNA ligase [Thermoleophilaceae bacterium]
MTEPHNKEAAALLAGTVDALPAGALEAQLDLGRPLRVKFGIDPTAPDIHLGHVVVLRKLREFQDLGHTVVLIIGDYTARVGDPSGRSATRPVLSPEQIDANAETFKRQAFTVLDRECTEIRRNSEWLDMSMQDLFALTRGSTVAQLLERDDFAKRFADRRPISILELLYPLLQGYDSHAVGADVELGGTDQKFNLLHARAIQQQYGSAQQSVLTMPILPGIDGVERMSKSLGNYVAVTDLPDQLFGKLMRIPDQVMPTYYELLLGRIPDPAAPPVIAKRALAGELTDRFHGAGAGAAAERAFDTLHVDHGIPDEIEEDALPDGETIHLPELLAGSFGISRSEARRLLAGGGVKLDGAALGRDDLDLDRARLEGAVLQIGRRRHRRYV